MAVIRGNYVKRGRGERETAKANIRYIQERPGRDKEKLTRPLFGSGGPMGRHEVYQFIDEAAKQGRYFYRFKFSPDPKGEDTKRDLNMYKLTRQMMKRLEKRFKTVIPWAGALHDDHTDIRHVHILAAIPRRLKKHELEALIEEVTAICQRERRELDGDKQRKVRRNISRQQKIYQPVKFTRSHPQSVNRHLRKETDNAQRRVKTPKIYPSCTCPRCHFPQSHESHGIHGCVSCGAILHKKRELTLSRKGRAWERYL